jgi:Family of unknown function (DUF5662)
MIKIHRQYGYNVLLHKWYVFIEACKLGIPWRGLVHDFSKFSIEEWLPRVNALRLRDDTNQDSVFENVNDELVLSWFRHYHKNPHHWQWWVSQLDNGECKVLPMTDVYRREMLADWRAVAKMPNRQDIVPWYLKNKNNIILHSETREWLEQELEL